MVDFNEVQCYRYYVSSEETDVQIQLTTYSGKVQIRANPNEYPQSWDAFKIHTADGDENESELILDLRPWVRKHIAK